jgi:hypothetical protein
MLNDPGTELFSLQTSFATPKTALTTNSQGGRQLISLVLGGASLGAGRPKAAFNQGSLAELRRLYARPALQPNRAS